MFLFSNLTDQQRSALDSIVMLSSDSKAQNAIWQDAQKDFLEESGADINEINQFLNEPGVLDDIVMETASDIALDVIQKNKQIEFLHNLGWTDDEIIFAINNSKTAF